MKRLSFHSVEGGTRRTVGKGTDMRQVAGVLAP